MTVEAQHRYADLIRLAGLDDDVKVLVIRANGPNLGSGADLPELMEIMANRDDDQGMRRLLRIPEDADVHVPAEERLPPRRQQPAVLRRPRRGHAQPAELQEDQHPRGPGLLLRLALLPSRRRRHRPHLRRRPVRPCRLPLRRLRRPHVAVGARPMGVRKFMEMVFTGRPFTAQEMYDCDFVNSDRARSTSSSRSTEKYALACSRSGPTDTVVAQKTFFEIYKQHQGEYMGEPAVGLLESLTPQLGPTPPR